MLARFFIDRPIFAWVLSLVILLVGGICAFSLPIELYPNITPPTVQVTANYPGADAQVVANTVAAPIEQQVNGVENMLYMSSQSANDGSYTLTVTFEIGTDVNISQVLVQNRVALATPQLPPQVQLEGVSTKKVSPTILFAINLTSPDRRFDGLYMSNFATIQLKDELARIKGVGDIKILGQRDYSMRLWLDPYKLATRGLTAVDVVNAVQNQNVQVAAGQVGQQPVPMGQQQQLTMSALGRLDTVKQFGDIVLKTGTKSSPANPVVYMRDVGRIELGAQNYDQTGTLDGQPSAGLAVFLLPGANALDVAEALKNKMKELQNRFPPGLEYHIIYDTTPFIRQSVSEVLRTLWEAILLVALVVLLFLQDWKAMILPMIDVTVSLVGTFAVLAVLGFSLNNLTLFGLVLAIGIVVDDALMVLENIERLIATGLDARAATLKAMGELTGPIVAITLVLSSVFLPSVFIPGLTGQFYRQFAVTISAAMIISAINAMTLTPSRAVAIFKTEEGQNGHEAKKEALPWWIFGIAGGLLTVWLAQTLSGADGPKAFQSMLGFMAASWLPWAVKAITFVPGALVGGLIGWFVIGPVNAGLGWVFRGFNRFFDKITSWYGLAVGRLLRLSVVVMAVYLGLIGLTGWRVATAPQGFIPTQDQGYLLVNIQLPDSASVQRTEEIMAHIDKIALGDSKDPEHYPGIPGVANTVGISGQSFLQTITGSNLGSMFVVLKSWEDRPASEYDDVIAKKIQSACAEKIQGAVIGVFRAPPITGLGNAGGFKLQTEQHGFVDLHELQVVTDRLVQKTKGDPHYAAVFSLYRADTPQLYVDVDREKIESLQVPIADVFQTLQVYMGGQYVNLFNKFGRTWQVNVQAEAPFRTSADILQQLPVRTTATPPQIVPLGTLVRVEHSTGPAQVMRYNMYTSAAINGVPAPGVSSGTVVDEMTRLAKEVDVPFEWTEMTFLEVQAGNVAYLIFGLGAVLVYLVLAAKYESWRLPLAVILVVPLCMLPAVLGMLIAGLPVDLFVQIGLLVLVGLASKNAILIVEFAHDLREAGKELHEAAREAAAIRFRPIIMTSVAFILSVVPLVLATGAGAEMRQSLGTAVFSGMIGVTLFGIFLTPVFFFFLLRLGGEKAIAPVKPASPSGDKEGENITAMPAREAPSA